jgi:hypothetical protein
MSPQNQESRKLREHHEGYVLTSPPTKTVTKLPSEHIMFKP